jgi:hypothetical protein
LVEFLDRRQKYSFKARGVGYRVFVPETKKRLAA